MIVADGGFDCISKGKVCEVMDDGDGLLYVMCFGGTEYHYLDGQLCDAGEHGLEHDHYIGFWLKGEEPSGYALA